MYKLSRLFLFILLLPVSFTAFSAGPVEYDEELFQAILKDDVAKVTAYLDSGGDIEAGVGEYGVSLLYAALTNGCLKVSKLLVERGADREHINSGLVASDDNTPLVNNIYSGNYEMIDYLISLKVDIGLVGEKGMDTSPVYLALKEKKYDIFELFLKNGANPLERESEGQAALIHAVKYDDLKALNLLIKYGYYKEYRWIKADVGLRMRSTPSLKGEKLGVIPFRERVILLEERGELLTIAGEKGRWSRVKWNDEEGWVFGGFLGAKYEPNLTGTLVRNLWVRERGDEGLGNILDIKSDGTFKFYFTHYGTFTVESSGVWVYDRRRSCLNFYHKGPEGYILVEDVRDEDFDNIRFDKKSGKLSYVERGVSREYYTTPMTLEEFKKASEEKQRKVMGDRY